MRLGARWLVLGLARAGCRQSAPAGELLVVPDERLARANAALDPLLEVFSRERG